MKIPSKIKLDSDLRNLYSYGLPKNIESSKPFVLDDVVRPFISESERMTPKRIGKAKQLEFLEKVFDNPFFGPYVFCISGYPNDTQSKMLAALIMNRAFLLYKDKKSKLPPKWSNLYLGFDNNVIKENYKPSLLILSNLTPDTSNQKIDKLRDCLEYHSNIPRIVICSGIDPVSFFNTRVYSQINGCIYLQSTQVRKVNEL